MLGYMLGNNIGAAAVIKKGRACFYSCFGTLAIETCIPKVGEPQASEKRLKLVISKILANYISKADN